MIHGFKIKKNKNIKREREEIESGVRGHEGAYGHLQSKNKN